MTATQVPNDAPADPEGRHRSRRRIALAVAAAVLLVGFAAAVVTRVVTDATRSVPDFPSLVDEPDPALHGTVAYYADRDGCVRLIAASGAASKELLCLPTTQDTDTGERLGKLIGPQLRWRDDGRLEVTMFRMRPDKDSVTFAAGSQQLVDPTTGAVEQVDEADLPTTPDPGPRPTTNRAGQRIGIEGAEGTYAIRLEEQGRPTRRLLEIEGPHDGYEVRAVYWSPDGAWIVVDDGRLLVLTPGDPARTRVLTDESDTVAFGEGARFAVTDRDLLTSS